MNFDIYKNIFFSINLRRFLIEKSLEEKIKFHLRFEELSRN